MFADGILYTQMKFIYVNIYKPELLNPRPVSNIQTHSTAPTTLLLEKPNITTFKNSFCYSGIVFWNSLPTTIKNVSSLGSFKTRLHKFFLEQY